MATFCYPSWSSPSLSHQRRARFDHQPDISQHTRRQFNPNPSTFIMAPLPNRNARGGRANVPSQQHSFRQDQSQASRGSRVPAGNAQASGSQSSQLRSETGSVNTPFPSQPSANNSHAVDAHQSSQPRIGSWRPTHHRGSQRRLDNGRATRGHASQQRVNNRQDVQRSTQTPNSNSRVDVLQSTNSNAPQNVSSASQTPNSDSRADIQQSSASNAPPDAPRASTTPISQTQADARQNLHHRRPNGTRTDAIQILQNRDPRGPGRSLSRPLASTARDVQHSSGSQDSSTAYNPVGARRAQDTSSDHPNPSQQAQTDRRTEQAASSTDQPRSSNGTSSESQATGPTAYTAPHRRNHSVAPPTDQWGHPSLRPRGFQQTAIPHRPPVRVTVSSLLANAGDRSGIAPHVSPNTAASYGVFGPLLRPGEIPKEGERRICDWLRVSFPSSPPDSQDTSSSNSPPPAGREPELVLTEPEFELSYTSERESSEPKEAPDADEGTAAVGVTRKDWHLHDLEKVHLKALEYQTLYKQTPEVAKAQLGRLPEVWELLDELVRDVADSNTSAANNGTADATNPSATGGDTRSFAFNRGRTARMLSRKIQTVIHELDPYLRHLNQVLGHLVDLRTAVWELCAVLEQAVERRDDPLPQQYRESGLRQEYGTMAPPPSESSSDLGRYVPLPGEDFGTFDNVYTVKFHSEIAIEERERARGYAQASSIESVVPDPSGALWDDPPSSPQSWRRSPPTIRLGQPMSMSTQGSSPLIHSGTRGDTGSLSPTVNREPPSRSPVASSTGLSDSRRQSQISDFELDDQFGPEPQRHFRMQEHQRLQKVLKRQEDLTEETRLTRYPLTCGTKVGKLRVPVKYDQHERSNNFPILLKRYSVTEVTILEFVIALANAVAWWELADRQTKKEACELRDFLGGVLEQLGYPDDVVAEGTGSHLPVVEEEAGLPAEENGEDLHAEEDEADLPAQGEEEFLPAQGQEAVLPTQEGDQDLAASVTSQGSGSSNLTLNAMDYVNQMIPVHFPNGAHTPPPRLESPLWGPQVDPQGDAGVDPFADPEVDRWTHATESLIMALAHLEDPPVPMHLQWEQSDVAPGQAEVDLSHLAYLQEGQERFSPEEWAAASSPYARLESPLLPASLLHEFIRERLSTLPEALRRQETLYYQEGAAQERDSSLAGLPSQEPSSASAFFQAKRFEDALETEVAAGATPVTEEAENKSEEGKQDPEPKTEEANEDHSSLAGEGPSTQKSSPSSNASNSSSQEGSSDVPALGLGHCSSSESLSVECPGTPPDNEPVAGTDQVAEVFPVDVNTNQDEVNEQAEFNGARADLPTLDLNLNIRPRVSSLVSSKSSDASGTPTSGTRSSTPIPAQN